MGEETLAADVTRGSRRGLYPVRWNLAVENLINSGPGVGTQIRGWYSHHRLGQIQLNGKG